MIFRYIFEGVPIRFFDRWDVNVRERKMVRLLAGITGVEEVVRGTLEKRICLFGPFSCQIFISSSSGNEK